MKTSAFAIASLVFVSAALFGAAAAAPCRAQIVTPPGDTPLSEKIPPGLERQVRESFENNQIISTTRMLGIARDKGSVALLRTYLKPNDGFNDRRRDARLPDEPVRRLLWIDTALQALGRIGAVEALPDIEAIVANPYWKGDIASYARVVRARILASKRKDAVDRLTTFLSELKIPVSRLNQVIAARKAKFSVDIPPHLIEVMALRELADMIYLERDLPLAQAAKEAGVDFGLDTAASLKLRFAPLKSEERIKVLVEEVAYLKVIRADQGHFLMQLLINEGKPAGDAAATKLRQMIKGPRFEYKATKTASERQAEHRRYLESKGSYTRIGFFALIRVLAGIGDSTHAALVKEFTRDSDKYIAFRAGLYSYRLELGIPIHAAFF